MLKEMSIHNSDFTESTICMLEETPMLGIFTKESGTETHYIIKEESQIITETTDYIEFISDLNYLSLCRMSEDC